MQFSCLQFLPYKSFDNNSILLQNKKCNYLIAKKHKKLYNNNMEYISNNLNDTTKLAQAFAQKLKGDEIILLEGDLGAGKTTFAKALFALLGVTEIVTSPTFAFMKEYYAKFKLSHYDMYRVECEDELWELGISDNLYERGVCVIEWNKFTEFPKDKKIIKIKIEKISDTSRRFMIEEVAV